MICRGWVPERPKGADCKSVVTDYDGSNPSPSTNFFAGMAELADAHGSGPCEGDFMQVQVLFPAPNQYNPNQIFVIGDGFGLFVFFEKFEDTHFRNGVVKRPESKPRGPRKPKLAKDKEDNYENH